MANGEAHSPPSAVAAESSGERVRKPWSMRAWLILVMGVALVSTAGAAGYGFVWTADQARDSAVERMAFRAERAAASISDDMAVAKSTVEALSAQPGLEQVFVNPGGCTLTVDGGESFPSARLDVVSPDGRVGCSSNSSAVAGLGAVHVGSGWLTQVSTSSETVVSWNATDAGTQQRAIAISAPFRTNGTFGGSVTLFLHLAGVADALGKELLAADSATLSIIDRTADAMLSTTGPEGLRSANGFDTWPTSGQWSGADGVDRLFGSRDVADSGWRIYVGAERSTVLAQAQGALLRQILVGVLALLILAAGVWVLSRRVAKPLRALTYATVKARESDGEVRVKEAGTSELQTLAREFNAMLSVRSGHEAQLAHQATHDQLTNLPNRIMLNERLDRMLHSETDAVPVAVLFCGLPRFSVINESLGHDVGDRVLAEAADRLRSVIRRGDTLARFGDDAFVVICRDTTKQQAVTVAERLHKSLAKPFSGIGDAQMELGAAIGIAASEGKPSASGQLLREADTAMREAKRTGQPWAVFEDDLHHRATQRIKDEEALRQALAEEQFVVWYQPIHNVATGTLVGAEALLRWQHPERGMVPPNDFIPLAEESGQITAIGRFVLRRACQEAADWAASGFPLWISINVAADQLHHPDFTSHVHEALAESGLPPELLCLEITESSIISEIGTTSGVLKALRKLGVEIAIDDFGTGYSSLSYLPRLPVSELKIDRSFISRVGGDTGEQHLVKAIIGMAGALSLTVVAEGVETSDQLEIITNLKCDLAQGYLFSRPMPAEAFLPHLHKQLGNRTVNFLN
jgi:diguanylate cyclase (GGDEF)-like protein